MSRGTVLKSIRDALAGRPAEPLPEPVAPAESSLTWEDFEVALKEALGTFLGPIPRDRLAGELQTLTGGELFYAGTAAELLGQPALELSAEELDGLPWAVARGWLAIASTGSVVIRDVEVPTRLQLLLPENLILLVPMDALVDDLVDCYERLDHSTLRGGYMTFISGPSKTADIELELVTGAHGPRSLLVIAYGP
jgi:hypothetical protein